MIYILLVISKILMIYYDDAQFEILLSDSGKIWFIRLIFAVNEHGLIHIKEPDFLTSKFMPL